MNVKNDSCFESFPDAHLHFFPELLSGSSVWIPRKVLINATSEADWEAVKASFEKEKQFVHPFFGIHPWWSCSCEEGWADRLVKILESIPSAGVGEIGLDALRAEVNSSDGSARERQIQVFESQLKIACDFRRPVSIHCVRAWDWLWPSLRKILGKSQLPLIFHAFSGSPEMVLQILENFRWNVFFSLAFFRFRPNSDHFWRLLRAIPEERLLLETDADSLPEAQKIGIFYRELALRLSISVEELAERVEKHLKVVLTS